MNENESVTNPVEQRFCSNGHGKRACLKVKGEWRCLDKCLARTKAGLEHRADRLRIAGNVDSVPLLSPAIGTTFDGSSVNPTVSQSSTTGSTSSSGKARRRAR